MMNNNFVRKLISIILPAAMLTTQVNAETLSDLTDSTSEYTIEAVIVDDLPIIRNDINDSVVGAQLYSIRPATPYSGSYYNQLDDDSKTVYNLIYNACKDGASTQDVVLTLPLQKTFADSSVSVSGGTLSLSEATSANINNWITDSIVPAGLALMYDHIELSWFSQLSYSFGYQPDYDNMNTSNTSCDIIIKSVVCTLKSTAFRSDCGDAASMNQAVATAKSVIDANLTTKDDAYLILCEIYKYLASTVTYNDEAAKDNTSYTDTQLGVYQTAYSAFYKCNNDSELMTVCAGYAKGLKMLCDAYSIPCAVITGLGKDSTSDAGGAHAWDYVKLGDNWYAVDITWDDQNGSNDPNHDFFLSGSSTLPSTGYSQIAFSESHVESTGWITTGDYHFTYPVLSATAYVYDPENPDKPQAEGTDGSDTSGGTAVINPTVPGADDGIGIVWANGKDIKDNKKTADVDETALYKTYTFEVEKMSVGGKWSAAVTTTAIDTVEKFAALFDANAKLKTTDSSVADAKKNASAKIKDGVVTVTAGKEAGTVNVWVYEVKNKKLVNTATVYPIMKKVNVLSAASNLCFGEAADFTSGVLQSGKKAVSKLTIPYKVGAASQESVTISFGDKKAAPSEYCGYTVATSDNTVATSCFASSSSVSITPLQEGKAKITLTNTQSSKKATLTVTVSPYYQVTFPEGVTVSYKSGSTTTIIKSGDYVPNKTKLTITAVSGSTVKVNGTAVNKGAYTVQGEKAEITI